MAVNPHKQPRRNRTTATSPLKTERLLPMDAIMKHLGEMSQLLLALNDNAAATNRRLELIEDRLSDLVGETKRNSDRLGAVELRLAELGVRLAALETT